MGAIQNSILNLLGSAQQAAGIKAIVNKQKELDTSVKKTGEAVEKTQEEVKNIPEKASEAAIKSGITITNPSVFTWDNYINPNSSKRLYPMDVEYNKMRENLTTMSVKNKTYQNQKSVINKTLELMKNDESAEDLLWGGNK